MRLSALIYVLIWAAVIIGADNVSAGEGVQLKLGPAISEIRPGILKGYLAENELPNSAMLLPPPPSVGSAAQKSDQEANRKTFSLRNSPRWDLAKFDANLAFPAAAQIFTCAIAAPIDQQRTPHLYTLLRRTLADAGLSTYAAKKKYQRARPFMSNSEPICTPDDTESLKKDGSYPSGHSAVGWAWALILTEIAPEHADAILARGRAFGTSREVCNVHWHSDVVQGRVMGASAVARLHANPEFRAQLAAAKQELAAMRATKAAPGGDCAVEVKALEQH